MTPITAPELRRLSAETRAIPEAKNTLKACRLVAASRDGLANRIDPKGEMK